MAPAIQMDKEDHIDTTSYGANKHAPYNQVIGAIANHVSSMSAVELEAINIQRLFPGKYDDAIAQARTYAECLKKSKLMT